MRVFICTYNNPQMLDRCLSNVLKVKDIDVTVINNGIPLISKDKNLKIINNVARPLFSAGHLARTWNQALMHGFVSLMEPATDFVVTLQDDVVLLDGWAENIVKHHQKYGFVQMGRGDEFCSYTAHSVQSIGMWDERFCNIQYQEADYFLRAKLFYGQWASINDDSSAHQRAHNKIENDLIDLGVLTGNDRHEEYNTRSKIYQSHSAMMFEKKWGISPENWSEDNMPDAPLIDSYITYPYFEIQIFREALLKQKYVII